MAEKDLQEAKIAAVSYLVSRGEQPAEASRVVHSVCNSNNNIRDTACILTAIGEKERMAARAKREEERMAEEARKAAVEDKRVMDVEAARTVRADGGDLTPRQNHLLLEDAAIRAARAAEKTAEIENERLAEHRKFQSREEKRKADEKREEAERRAAQEKKTIVAAAAATALGYTAMEHIANKAADKVAESIRENRKD